MFCSKFTQYTFLPYSNNSYNNLKLKKFLSLNFVKQNRYISLVYNENTYISNNVNLSHKANLITRFLVLN